VGLSAIIILELIKNILGVVKNGYGHYRKVVRDIKIICDLM
jgi:hypothetical protein